MSGIDLLSLPKGSSSYCEVCRRPGVQRCPECKVTYYCGKSHKDLDWNSFHRLICQEVAYLHGEHPFPIGVEERLVIEKELNKRKRQIQEKAEDIARELILREKPELAYAPAMQAFHHVNALCGDDSLDIIRPYVLLSEVYLGLENIKLAQDYMLQAAWTMEKEEMVPVQALIDVNRMKGKVYMKTGKWTKANEAFAEYVYYLAEQYGTSDIRIAVGFGYLGLTIKALGKSIPTALELFNKMSFMWVDKLLDLYISKTLEVPTEKEMEDPVTRENECLLLEAEMVLKMIDESVQEVATSEALDRFIFKLYVIQVFLSIREGDKGKKDDIAKAALVVCTRTRMDREVREEKRKYVNEVLGADYLLKWDKKHRRPRTIATKYLDLVRKLIVFNW